MADKNLQYSIDARQAEAGARQFVKAVKTIREQSKTNIRGTAEDFMALQKAVMASDFTKIARDLRRLTQIKFSTRGMSSYVAMLRELSSFKGPSAAAISRLNNLGKAINAIGKANAGKAGSTIEAIANAAMSLERIGSAANNIKTLKSAVTGLARMKPQSLEKLGLFFQMLKAVRISSDVHQLGSIAASLKEFRPPTAARVANLGQLFLVLQNARIPRGVASGLMGVATSMRTFKPPTNAQIERFKAFIMALNGLKLRKDFGAFASALDRITAAASRSSRAFSMLRKNMTNMPFNRAKRGVHGLTGSLRGLENAFSLSYHAGSALRTLLGALSLGTFARSVYDTSVMYLKAEAAIRVVAGSQEATNKQMAEAIDMIQRTGGAIDTVLPRYAKFIAAAGQSGLTVKEATGIFEAVSGSLTVLGANAEDSELAFLAIEQIISKGVLSSEELRRQLAERLPGSFQIMAKALYPTIVATQGMDAAQAKLNKDLKSGSIQSVEAMKRFAAQLEATYGPELQNALKRPDVALRRLGNEWTFFKKTVADSGFLYELGIAFDKLVQAMRTDEFHAFAVQLGEGLGRAVQVIADAAIWAFENIDKIRKALKAAITVAIIFKSINLARSVQESAMGFLSMFKFAGMANGAMMSLIRSMGLLRAAMIATGIGAIVVLLGTLAALLWKNRDATYELGGEMVTVGETVKAVWDIIVDVVATSITFMWNAFKNWNNFLTDLWSGIGLDFSGMIDTMIWAVDQFFNHWDNMLNKLDLSWKTFGNNLQMGTDTILFKSGLMSKEDYYNKMVANNRQNTQNQADFNTKQADIFGREGIISGAMGKVQTSVRDRILANRANKPGAADTTNILPDPKKSGLTLFGTDYGGKGGSDKEELKAQARLLSKVLPMRQATLELAASEKRLMEMRKSGVIPTDKLLAEAQQNLRREYEDQIDPIKALMGETDRSIALMQKTLNAAPGVKEYYEYMAKLRHDNAEAQADENKELKEKMRLEASLERFSGVRDRVNPLQAAQRNYNLDRQSIIDAVPAGPERDRMLESLKRRSQSEINPVASMRNSFAEKGILSRMDDTSARRYQAVREQINALEDAGVTITHDLVTEVTALVAAQDKLDNPTGFQRWIDEARTLGEVMSDLKTNVLDEFSASMGKLFATGDFGATDFLTAIRDEAAQGAGDLFTKEAANVVGLGNKGGIIGGLKKGAMSLFDGKKGNFLSSFGAGYSEINKDGLSKGDNAIVTVLEQIRDAIDKDETGGLGALGSDPADLFNGGGIFGKLFNKADSLFGGGSFGKLDGFFEGGLKKGPGGILGSLFGGGSGGGGGGILSMASSFFTGGIPLPFFKEGGITGSAVAHGMVSPSAFMNAPRFAAGTPNISSGEHPAILHDNEAVIPLSRGRFVPVQMNGGSASDGGSTTNQNVTFNIMANDPNEFRRSEHQLKARAARSLRSA